MGRFFDLDNGFFRFLNKVFDMIVLNLLVLVLCIPVITAGPAIASMYYIAMKEVRDEEGYVVRPFFNFFKKNFKQGVILELLAIGASVLMICDVYIMYQWTQNESGLLLTMLFAILISFSIICAITIAYVFPMLAKFENTTKRLVLNSLMMAVRHLPQSVLIVLIIAGCGVLVYIYPIAVLFAVGLAGFLTSLIFVKIFDNYIPAAAKAQSDQSGEAAEEISSMEEREDTEDTQ